MNQRQLDAAKGSHMYQHIETEELLMDLKSVAIYLNKDSLSSKEYGKMESILLQRILNDLALGIRHYVMLD